MEKNVFAKIESLRFAVGQEDDTAPVSYSVPTVNTLLLL